MNTTDYPGWNGNGAGGAAWRNIRIGSSEASATGAQISDDYRYVLLGGKVISKEASFEYLQADLERMRQAVGQQLLQLLDSSPFLASWVKGGVSRPTRDF